MPGKLRKLGLQVALAGLQSYRSGIQQINAGNAATQESMTGVAEESKKLDLGMAALTGSMMSLASKGIDLLVGGLKRLGQEIYQMASEAGVVAGLKGSFEGLSNSIGLTGDEMLEKFRRATGGMVTMKDAMMSFNKASQLISTDFASMLPDAMKYMGKVSRATGANIDYLLDSLVVGIGRLSPMILDNLSIQVSLAEASERAAQMFDVEKDALTKTQKQLGMANVVMEKLARNTAHMPGVTGTATAQMASMQAVIKDVRTEIGLRFLPILGEAMNVMNTVANAVLPKLVPIAEKAASSIMGMITWFKQFRPATEVISVFVDVFGALKDTLTEALSGPVKIWKNWFMIIKAQLDGIVKMLGGDLVGSIKSAGEFLKSFFHDTLGPAIMEVSKYLTYFFRVARDIFTGLEALLKGDTERATKFFSQAFNTAISVVIALLKKAANQVVVWGQKLMASYSQGIVDGIKMFLANALQAVAGYLSSFMAPGSPPKFLPDIGTWGAGAMEEYVKGMGDADFSLLSQYTGQFRDALSGMVQTGDLEAGDFADTFFELRGVVTEVMDTFKRTGEIGANALDPLRDKLGETGEAMAEMLERQLAITAIEDQMADLQESVNSAMAEVKAGFDQVAVAEAALDAELQPFINDLEKLKAQEDVATAELRRAFEAGEIGIEEYEDRVKAVKDETAVAEQALNLKKAEQVESRNAIETQKTTLDLQKESIEAEANERMAALEEQRKALTEELSILEGRLGIHQETLDVLKQQETMLESMKEAAAPTGGSAGEEGKGGVLPTIEGPDLSGLEDALPTLDELRQKWEDIEVGGEKFDLGEILPDVEETKAKVSEWFKKSFEGIRTAAQQSPVVQWILDAILVKLPEIVTGVSTWLQANFPMAFHTVPKILEKVFSGDFQSAIQLAIGWFEWLKNYIAIWWMTEVEPKLQPFVDWWNKTWPIIQAVALTAWTVIQSVVTAVVNTIVDTVWPKLQQAWDNLSESLHLGEITWKDVWEAIKKAVMVVAAVIGAVLVGVIAAVVGVVNAIASAAQTITSAMKNLSQGWTKIWAAMIASLKLAKKFIMAIIHGDFAAAWEAIKGGLEATKVFWQGIWQVIKGTFEATIGLILSIIGGFVEGVIDFFTNLYKDLVGESIVPDMLTEIFDSFKDIFENILEKVGEFIDGVIQFFKDLWSGLLGPEGTITTLVTDIWDTITGIIDDIIETIGLKVTEFTSLGTNLMQGFINGIKDAVINIKNAIGEVIGDALGAAREALGIHSASRKFMELAAWSAEGWTKQWDQEVPKIERQMSMDVAPALMMGNAPQPIGTTNNVQNVDQSVRHGDQQINMPVTVIDSKVSLSQFKETFRQVLNERG